MTRGPLCRFSGQVSISLMEQLLLVTTNLGGLKAPFGLDLLHG